ncbi:ABC transporter permease [Aestuariirhabdus sp. Z084]|uniref:ABC transporter permease n=1 Tax=Aestuariirhabdus haliotis TaxID=2918751 RepID=UPI00201B44DC|nr:ABC transporter permease [Aestuariirhabdus haliotis]MCL6416862.1 ABC transporter permease [Aestuariirhabdus haliotis]MCL6420862.1 ABC transporter permease [Aestuariirhabdus haliotis]
MSLIAFMGAIETGLLFGLVALGVYISFRILDFPDLTVDGSFPLGAAISATAIVAGINPWLATAMALGGGALAGALTAWLNVRLKILHLLASILVMIALYSINLRIMGKPNVALLGETTLLTPVENWAMPYYFSIPLAFTGVVALTMVLVTLFLKSEIGLSMRATGANDRMARAHGVATGWITIVGMALANALVALAGSLFAQSQGSADVTMGVGVIVIGLAAVIGGEAIMSTRTVVLAVVACVLGAILYRLAIAFALNADFIGLKAQDLNLITAALVTIAIVLPGLKKSWFGKRKGATP